MSNWTVRCANPRCRHVHAESARVDKPHEKQPYGSGMTITQSTCPKCGCKSYYRANAKDLARAAQQSSRVEAATAAE